MEENNTISDALDKSNKKENKNYFSLKSTIAIIAAAIILLSLGVYFIGTEFLWKKPMNPIVEKRIDKYKDLIEENPNEPSNYVELGYAYYLEDRYDDASKYFSKAIEMDKDYYPGYLNLASSYYEDKSYDEALKILKKAIKLAPRDYSPLLIQGKCYFGKEEYKKAIESYEKVLELSPANVTSLFGIGESYRELGDKKKAEEFYNKALEYNPNNKTIKKALKDLK